MGAVGLSLAVCLQAAGKQVQAVRIKGATPRRRELVTLHGPAGTLQEELPFTSLSELGSLRGTLVLTTKAHANAALAAELATKAAGCSLVVMQNGLGIETPFLEASFEHVHRCVLYVTAQKYSDTEVLFRPIRASPIGVLGGDASRLAACVDHLSTPPFPFRLEQDISGEVWRKTIVNCAFNSLCPLLDVDNGIFARDAGALDLASQIVRECLHVARREGADLSEESIVEQILQISRGSDGVPISTLQDIRLGRETEIEHLNLEVARRGSSHHPKLVVPLTELSGRLVAMKARVLKRHEPAS